MMHLHHSCYGLFIDVAFISGSFFFFFSSLSHSLHWCIILEWNNYCALISVNFILNEWIRPKWNAMQRLDAIKKQHLVFINKIFPIEGVVVCSMSVTAGLFIFRQSMFNEFREWDRDRRKENSDPIFRCAFVSSLWFQMTRYVSHADTHRKQQHLQTQDLCWSLFNLSWHLDSIFLKKCFLRTETFNSNL